MTIQAAKLAAYIGVDGVQDAKRALKSFSRDLTRTAKNLRRMGTVMTAGLTAPLTLLARQFVNTASDYEESLNKVDVVFGESANEIRTWAEGAAENLGMSSQAAMEAASSLGAFFKTAGAHADVLPAMSKNIVKLATDFGSLYNVDPTDMLEKFRSGLAGDSEPLRRFGIDLSAARTEAKALELGLAKTRKEISEGDKVAARYALIMEQGAIAMGDFARTADGAANSGRILTAMYQDMAAELGQELLPYKIQLNQLLIGLLRRFRGLSPEVKRNVVVMGALVAALGPLLVGLGMIANGVMAVSGVLGGLIGVISSVISAIVGGLIAAISAVGAPVALLIAAVAALALAWEYNWGGIQDITKRALEDVTTWIKQAWGWVSNATAQAWEFVRSVTVRTWEAITGALRTVLDWILNAMRTVLETISRAWQAASTFIYKVVFTRFKAVADFIRDVLVFIASRFKMAWQIAVETTRDALQGILSALGRGLSNAANALASFLEKVPGIGGALASGLRGAANAIVGYIRDANELVRRFLNIDFGDAVGSVTAELGDFTEKMKEFRDDVGDALRSIFDVDLPELNIGEWLKQIIEEFNLPELVDFVRSQIPDLVQEGLGWITEKAGDLYQSLIDRFKELMESGQVDLSDLFGYQDVDLSSAFDDTLLGIDKVKKALQDAGVGSEAVADAFEQMKEQVNKALEYVDFQLKQGLIDPVDAIRERISILSRFAEQAFKAGFKEAAAEAAAEVVLLRKQLDEMLKDAAGANGDNPLQRAADLLKSITDGVRSTLEQWQAMAALGPATFETGGLDILGAMQPQVEAIITWWANLYDNIKEIGGKAEAAAQMVDGIMRPIRSLVESMDALYNANKGRLDGILAHTRPRLVALVEWLGRIYDDIKDVAPEAMAAAGAIDNIVKPLRGLMEGMNALYEGEKGHLDGILAHTRPRLVALVEWLNRVWEDIQDAAPNAQAGAKAIGEIVQPLRGLMDGMKALYEGSKGRLNGILAHTRPRLMAVIQWLSRLWNDVAGVADDARAASGFIGEISENLSSGMQILQELKAWRSVRDVEDRFTQFRKAWDFIVEEFDRTRRNVGDLVNDDLVKFSQMLENLADGLEKALHLLTQDLYHIRPPSMDIWQPLVDWVTVSVQLLLDWIADNPNFGDDSTAVEAFGNALDSLMQGLEAALSIVQNFDFQRPDAAVWKNFEDWVITTFTYFYDWVNATGQFERRDVPFGDEGLKLVQAFADALNSLMQALEAALNMSLSMPKDWARPDANVWGDFETWVKDVFASFANWILNSLSDDIDLNSDDPFGLISAASEAMGRLWGALSDALSLAMAMPPDFSAPDIESAAWTGFENFVKQIFQRFYDWINSTGTYEGQEIPFGEDGLNLVSAFGDALSGLMGGLASAFEVFQGLITFVPPSEARMDAFVNAVRVLFTKAKENIVDKLETGSNEVIQAFGEALGSLMDGLRSALDLFKDLAGTDPGVYTPGTLSAEFEDRLGNLIEGVHTTLMAFKSYVQDKAGSEWIPASEEFLKAVRDVFGILRQALDLFVDLEANNLPSTQTIVEFVDSVLFLFREFATGLNAIVNDLSDAEGESRAVWSAMLDNIPDEATAKRRTQVVGKGLIDGLKSNLLGGLGTNTVEGWARYVADRVYRPIHDNVLSYAEAKWLGNQIDQGLIDGLNSGSKMVAFTAYNLGRTVDMEMRRALGIASPAAVAVESGQMVGWGMVVGMDSYRPAVREAAARLAADIHSGLKSDIPLVYAQMPAEKRIILRHEVTVRSPDGSVQRMDMRDLAAALSDYMRVGV